MSNSSPIPVPIAVIIAWISLFESTLLIRFFSLLMIFPRSGRIAWYVRSRPVFAEPPAESPSTMKSSASDGSRIEQSASLPGSEEPSSADLRRVSSRAWRAASRARIAAIALLQIARASWGFSSRNRESEELTVVWTRPSTPGLPSFVFVCPSNCGLRSLTETTAARPSRTSSPSRLSFSFRSLSSVAFAFSVRVSALRKPDRCVPPSTVLMLLAKVKTDSW